MAFCLLLFWQASGDPVAEGMKALESQKYAEAVELFKRAVAKDSSDVQAHFQLGAAYTGLKQVAAAKGEYAEVLRLSPKLYQAEMNLGLLLLQEGAVKDALPHLATAVEQKPASAPARRAYGDGLLAATQFKEAETQYEAASPKTADVEIGLARALAGQGRLQDAAPHYEKAAALDPYFLTAPLELAQKFEAAGKKDEAIALYRRFSSEKVSQERMAALELQLGDFQSAVPKLESALAKDPSAANRLALATAYLKTQHPEKAAPLLEQSIRENPSDLEVRLTYGRILRDQKKYPAAAQEFYKVVQAKPDNREAWGELAGMLILMEQYPQALTALDRVKALSGENAGYYYLRAIVLDKTKQFKPALESYQKFLSLSEGKSPDEEFKARQRARILQREIQKH